MLVRQLDAAVSASNPVDKLIRELDAAFQCWKDSVEDFFGLFIVHFQHAHETAEKHVAGDPGMQTNSKDLSSGSCVSAVRMLVMMTAAAMVMTVLMAVVVMMFLMVVHWLLLIGKRRENLIGEAGRAEPVVNIYR